MKRIFKTTVCAVIGAFIASPHVSAQTHTYPKTGQTVAQQRSDVRECNSSRKRPDVVRETATGAAIGAAGGAIGGNLGQGALIGAGVGAADSATVVQAT